MCYTVHVVKTNQCDPATTHGCTKWDISNALLGQIVVGKENELKVSDAVATLSYIVVAISDTFLLVCVAIIIRFYNTRIMRFSQRQVVLGIIACGMIGVSFTPLLMTVNDTTCATRTWFIGLPIFTMFNLLLGKTYRIWKLLVSSSLRKTHVLQTQVLAL